MVKIVYTCLIFCCLVLVVLLGCGGDEVEEEKDPLEDLVGTYELVKIGGKTPEAYFQNEIDAEVSEGSMKLVFAPDGSLYREASFLASFTETIDPAEIYDLMVDVIFELKFKFTVNGSYVASGSTLEIISGDQINTDFSITVSVDVETLGVPELEEFEQELNEKA